MRWKACKGGERGRGSEWGYNGRHVVIFSLSLERTDKRDATVEGTDLMGCLVQKPER